MQPSVPDFEDGLDAELRRVPLPEGLLQRLRQAALTDDEGLDATLRYIQVPSGLWDEVRRIPLADDEGLDAVLCDVSLPVNMADRLRRVPLESNEGLDAALRHVPIPASVVSGFELPKRRLSVVGLVQWATALSLTLLIGASYFGAMVAFLVVTYRPNTNPKPPLTTNITIEWSNESEEPPIMEVGPVFAMSDTDDDRLDRFPVPVVEVEQVEKTRWPEHVGAMVNLLFDADGGNDPFLNANLLRNWAPEKYEKTLTHPYHEDGIDLNEVSGLVRRAVHLPKMFLRREEVRFLSQFRVHPFIPILHPKLQVSQVPLGANPLSYEWTLRYLLNNELPPPKVVRTEEFLAAVDYHFPRPRRRNAAELYVTGGKSPFGAPGTSLLQIGVRARDFGNLEYPTAHLIVLVEVSPAMGSDGRLDMVRRSIRKLVRQLGPEDRISLVAFSDDVEVLLEQAGSVNEEEVSESLKSLSPERTINVGAGLREAYTLAQRGTMFYLQAPKVVLLSDGLAGMGRGITDPIEHRLADAAAHGISLDVIDVRQEEEPDLQLAGFAQAGGGSVHRAASADEIRWALLEIMTGKDQLVAKKVELKVTFDPKTVAAYRIFGHEATAVDETTELAVDFHAGQSDTVLYELLLRPDGGKQIAKVDLTWQPPGAVGSLDQQTVSRNVRRDQLASDFGEAAPSLQAAVLVAQTAEILRGSPFATLAAERLRNSPLAREIGTSRMGAVLWLADKADTELYNWPSFAEFMSMVEKADKARIYRRPHRRGERK